MLINGVTHSTRTFDPPPGACDCHTHVFGPESRFPYDKARAYTPPNATIEDLDRLHRHLGIDRVVIVHPSPYGADNRVSVAALEHWGLERARGVAVIDGATTDAELDHLHKVGMRGARENLETAGVRDPVAAWSRLQRTADRIAQRGWHVQVFASLEIIAALSARLAALPLTIVIDHFGRPGTTDAFDQPAFKKLRDLVASGKAYVKLSASYRISRQSDHADVAPLAKALIAANPDRILWGTDWPHPGGGARTGASREAIEPFLPIDDGMALNRLHDWTGGDRRLLERILVENPARLYGFPPTTT